MRAHGCLGGGTGSENGDGRLREQGVARRLRETCALRKRVERGVYYDGERWIIGRMQAFVLSLWLRVADRE